MRIQEVCDRCYGTGMEPFETFACFDCDGCGTIETESKEIHKYRNSGYSHEMKKSSSKHKHKESAREKNNNKYGQAK